MGYEEVLINLDQIPLQAKYEIIRDQRCVFFKPEALP
jgi:hypothetical protein